jgi:hypothetical protein
MVQQQSSKKQTEEHHQATNQIGYSSIFEYDANKETDCGSRKIEKNKDQHEFEERSPFRLKSDHGVDDNAHNNWGYQP